MTNGLSLTPAQLDEATRLGLIAPDQRNALLVFSREPIAARSVPDTIADGDESFRLVGGGNDVFVALGIVLLMSGVWSAITTWVANVPAACGLMGLFLWGLAEIVTRRRRMKLSSLIISVAFTATIIAGLGFWIAANVDFITIDNPLRALDLRDQIRSTALIAIAAVAAGAIVWFARFRVPIMTAVLVLTALAFAAIGIADGVVDGIVSWRTPVASQADAVALGKSLLWVPLVMGLVVFVIGVVLDLKDRHRDTLLSDCAFWMHVISAPLIVHPLFVLATGTMPFFANILPIETGSGDASATVTLLVLVAVFFYTALAIDRRSLLVPALGYFATVGIVSLVQATASTTGVPVFAVVLALVGILVIVFGAGWQNIRRAVIATTLPGPVLRRLPPIATRTA